MSTVQHPRIIKRFGLSLVVAAIFCLSFGLFYSPLANAGDISFQAARDCNTNAIISCGSLTTGQLISAYSSNSYAQKVYAYFNISSSDIKNLPATAAAGHVDKNGNVYLNGRSSPVATNALTAGRQNTVGSTALSSYGADFYTRPLNLALTTNSADAFVVMNKGRFDYAIIASCDNPVTIKPAVVTQPVVTTPAPIVPVAPVAPTTPQAPLVNTGPIDNRAIALFVTVIALSTVAAYYYQLRRLNIKSLDLTT